MLPISRRSQRRTAALLALLLGGCSVASDLDSTAERCPGACPGAACASDAECAAGARCSVAGRCIPEEGCASDGDCKAGTICDLEAGACKPGGGCDLQTIEPRPLRSNLLLVVDRSCSMKSKIAGSPKWDAAVTALVGLSTAFADRFRIGLELFPDTTGDKCAQDPPAVPVSDDGAEAAAQLLNAALDPANELYPSGPCVTNIDSALDLASKQPALAEPRPSQVLLVTDGNQLGCDLAGGSAGAVAIAEAMAKQGVKTFVVGFGSTDKTDEEELDTLAKAGGAPQLGGAHAFYLAEDPASLEQTLSDIASSVVSCTYLVDGPVPDPAALDVFLDDAPVPRDPGHAHGWDYDPESGLLTLYGEPCASLQVGQAKHISIVVECPPAS